MSQYSKPLPAMTPGSSGFWEGCKRHQLLIQRCQNCGTFRHYPHPMCPNCNSTDAEWAPVSGQGKVYSMTVVQHPTHPAFADVPYAVVIVELEEGMRMVGDVVDAKPEEIYIGMPVTVVFNDVTEDVTLPRFKKL
jgi:uncharacterized OB-fold protein